MLGGMRLAGFKRRQLASAAEVAEVHVALALLIRQDAFD